MTVSTSDRMGSEEGGSGSPEETEGHFVPKGTMFILAMFVVVLILLWLSVYAILIARGVTT